MERTTIRSAGLQVLREKPGSGGTTRLFRAPPGLGVCIVRETLGTPGERPGSEEYIFPGEKPGSEGYICLE